MSWGAVAVGAATLITGYMSQQQRAQAEAAANRQNVAMSKEQIAEDRRQFEVGREDTAFAGARQEDVDRQLVERFRQLRGENVGRLDPYSRAGGAAAGQRAAMLGLGTTEEQRAAEARFTESPGQRFLRNRMEKTLIRNAAAMGGLGGGNVKTALQEQAMGLAQTDRDRYLQQLGAVSGEGMEASGQIIGMGQGPQVGETTAYGERFGELKADRLARQERERKRKEEERKRRQQAAAGQAANEQYRGSGGEGGQTPESYAGAEQDVGSGAGAGWGGGGTSYK
jgi:hypothetical protein